MALEGLIMCTNNKVSRWRDNLDEERKWLMINIAMKSKKDQRKKYLQRLQEMKAKRTAKMAEVKETKEKKEMGLRNEKEKLTKDLDDTGGLWKSIGEIEENLRKCHSEREKLSKLKIQLKFREKLLVTRRKISIYIICLSKGSN